MPGIPLLNLGTALGGLAGGWNQARSQGLQQALQQLMQQQYQDQSTGQALASLAAQAGLLNQPGQTPLGQSFPSPQQPPTVNVANITPPASASGGGAQPGYAPPLGNSPYGPPGDSSQAAPPDDSGDLTPAGQVMHNPKVLASWQDASGPGYVLPGGPVQPSSQTASSGGSDTTPTKSMPTITATPGQIAPGGIQSGGSDSGQQSGGGSVGMQFGNGPPIDMSTMFQRLDYQKLAQGIAQLAPPGTSQSAIYSAVVDLAKLADGDKTQQQQAAYMLKLLGIQGRMVEIGQQGAIRSGQIAQQGQIRSGQIAQQGDIKSGQITQQGQQRSDLQTQKDTAAEQRQKERLAQQAAQFNQRLQQTSRIANTTAKDTQLRALLGDIDKQLNPGGFSVPPQGDELFQLQRERVQIVNELRKLQGLPPVAMPQTPASQ